MLRGNQVKTIIFFPILLLSWNLHAADLKGVASTLDGKTLVYTEIHKVTTSNEGFNKKIETKYLKPDGEIFAEMESDFTKSLTVPDVKFTDKRFNKTEELTFNPSNKLVIFKTIVNNNSLPAKEFKFNETMAVGQGFDNFVKINFENLKNKTVPLKFGVLSEMDFFSFKGYKKKKDSNNNIIQFGIELSSLLFRLFTNELILEYDLNTKQLLSYKGLSNILTDEQKTQSVFIKYERLPKGS